MLEFDPKRRDFLKLLGLTCIGMALAQARPWTSRRWWPIFSETAASYRIPRLIDVGGPLHEHDVTANREFDYSTHALEEGIDWFEYVISNYPEMESWAGYCPPLASAGIFEPKPKPGRYLEETKEGLLVVKNAVNPMIPISVDAMKTLLSRGRWVVVDAPDLGVRGSWFRAAYSITGSRIGVTAWGAGHIEIPINRVVSAWVPIYDPEEVVEVDERIEKTGAWRLKELKLDVVDYIVNT